MEGLKPCPFCGAEPRLVTAPNSEKSYVLCKNTKCCGQPVAQHLPNEAVKLWNTRPIEDALQARIAELESTQNWRPIETAPKDTTILLCTKETQLCGYMTTGEHGVEWFAIGGIFDDGGTVVTDIDPPSLLTHWMPIPKGPEV